MTKYIPVHQPSGANLCSTGGLFENGSGGKPNAPTCGIDDRITLGKPAISRLAYKEIRHFTHALLLIIG
jgi:hypothetical protein